MNENIAPLLPMEFPREVKACSYCARVRPLSKFFKTDKVKSGWTSWCNECINRQTKKHRCDPRGKFTIAKRKAAHRGLSFEISFDQYKVLINRGCYYCGTPILRLYGTSLDRINNEVGYTLENVLPCCPMCNRIKHVYLTVNEMKAVAKLLKDLRSQEIAPRS